MRRRHIQLSRNRVDWIAAFVKKQWKERKEERGAHWYLWLHKTHKSCQWFEWKSANWVISDILIHVTHGLRSPEALQMKCVCPVKVFVWKHHLTKWWKSARFYLWPDVYYRPLFLCLLSSSRFKDLLSFCHGKNTSGAISARIFLSGQSRSAERNEGEQEALGMRSSVSFSFLFHFNDWI